jgi:1-acyl-sn-glycerol-3-phosphate acyltransferase
MLMRALRQLYFILAYYLSWVAFAVVAFGLNFACLPLRALPRTRPRARRVRAAIRALFDLWVRWFHATGVLRIRWHGFASPLPAGTVYIANHPSLLDATILLARLPDAVCIFKPALMRNPAIGTAAIMADYSAGHTGLDLVRDVADKILAGQSLLIFPEGTRTAPDARLEPLKPGFALIASRAQAPVQLIVIRASRGLVPRGRAWWRPPEILPAEIDLTLDRRWPHDPARPSQALTDEVERHLRARLAAPAA